MATVIPRVNLAWASTHRTPTPARVFKAGIENYDGPTSQHFRLFGVPYWIWLLPSPVYCTIGADLR